MTTYTSYTATGTSGDDTFSISGESAWISFRNKSVNGSTGNDTFQVIDSKNELKNFSVSVTNGIATVSTSSAKVYLTGFEKITYNGVTKWEAAVATNHAPTVTTPIVDQTATASSAFAFTVPSNSFTDSDGNTLTYSATLSDGTALPSWLSFNTTSRAFSGTPTTAGTISVKVTASDGSLSTYDTFNIAVAAAVIAPGTGNDTVTGTAAADSLNGYAGNDTLTGLAGNDTLDGGTGADSIAGGLGNDTYVVDNAGDVVTEASGQGTDLIKSDVSFTLSENVENLTLTSGGNINGTGNSLANTITGNAGNNVLDGSAGADKLIGGSGDDTYVIDTTSDKITEKLNEGTDTVNVAIAAAGSKYTLAANVENGVITSTVAFSLTGNASNNILTGNAAINTLNGGAGNDTLIGGLGKDVLTGGAGSDVFRFDVTFSNTDFDTITDFASGTDKISLGASLVAALGGAVDSSELWLKTLTSTQSATQYLIYDKTSGTLSYDADANGAEVAVTIALIGAKKTHPTLSFSDFLVA